MSHLPQRLTTSSIPDVCPCYNSCLMVARLTSSLQVKICAEKCSLKGGKDENHCVPNPSCMADGPKFPHRNIGPGFEVFLSCAGGVVMQKNHSIPKKTGIFSVVGLSKLFSVAQYFGGKCESMFQDVHWQNNRRAL